MEAASVMPLCTTCHRLYDGLRLNLRPHLTQEEWEKAVEVMGEARAKRRLEGSLSGESGSS
jgi:hypothetical protein